MNISFLGGHHLEVKPWFQMAKNKGTTTPTPNSLIICSKLEEKTHHLWSLDDRYSYYILTKHCQQDRKEQALKLTTNNSTLGGAREPLQSKICTGAPPIDVWNLQKTPISMEKSSIHRYPRREIEGLYHKFFLEVMIIMMSLCKKTCRTRSCKAFLVLFSNKGDIE